MNLVSTGVDTGVSALWVNCNADIDTLALKTHEVSARVYIGGLDKTPVSVKFIWNPPVKVKLIWMNRKRGLKGMEFGRRHVLAFVQTGPDGTLLLTQISTGGYAVDVYADNGITHERN